MRKSVSINLLKTVLFGTVFFILNGVSYGQLRFSGLGRTVFHTQQISGRALEGDTLSDLHTSQGYALFDLRTEYNLRDEFTLKDKFKVMAETRLKNSLGGFGGVGLSLTLRQFLIQGQASRFVQYQVGDIDIQMTPYTFCNDSSLTQNESSVFRLRREIVQYENFNVGNNWRMRGGKAELNFPVWENRYQVKFLAFGVTDRSTTSFKGEFPVRAGGKLAFQKGQSFGLEGNVVSHEDPSIGNQTSKITVLSGKIKVRQNLKSWELGIEVETGNSASNRNLGDNQPKQSLNDYFYEGQVQMAHRKTGLTFGLGYREVGPSFESPGAQSLRISAGTASQFLPFLSNASQVRNQGMLDQAGSETIQNQSISSYRQAYIPQYSLVLPYGQATPNRRGFQFNSQYKEQVSGTEVSLNYQNLQEIFGEGNTALRSFSRTEATARLNFAKWIPKQKLSLTGTFRRETSLRGGTLPTDLSVNFMDIGASWQLVKDVDFHLGWKRITAKGNEITSNIGTNNSIESYTPYTLDNTENLLGGGLQFHFTSRCFLLVSGYANQVKNTDSTTTWNLNQLYTNFSFRF